MEGAASIYEVLMCNSTLTSLNLGCEKSGIEYEMNRCNFGVSREQHRR